jgi:hypothetical protein
MLQSMTVPMLCIETSGRADARGKGYKVEEVEDPPFLSASASHLRKLWKLGADR